MINLIIFCDFDGTITNRDVGNRLFHHFSAGRSDAPVQKWRRGEIDSRTCLLEEAALMRDITAKELHAYLDSFVIDHGLQSLLNLASERAYPFYVLSDGLDIYIKYLLDKNGYNRVEYITNRGRLEKGRMVIETPYFENSCGSCANCKGYQIRRLRRDGQTAIYIGDGKSDLCALGEADIVFAKDYLAEYCRRENIAYIPYEELKDIAVHLMKLQTVEDISALERSRP